MGPGIDLEGYEKDVMGRSAVLTKFDHGGELETSGYQVGWL